MNAYKQRCYVNWKRSAHLELPQVLDGVLLLNIRTGVCSQLCARLHARLLQETRFPFLDCFDASRVLRFLVSKQIIDLHEAVAFAKRSE